MEIEDASVQDAYIGVHAYSETPQSGTAISGGLIYALESQFTNNRVAIQIDEYSNAPNFSFPPLQHSVIVNNQFSITLPFKKLNESDGYKEQIRLHQAGGINIFGNYFEVTNGELNSIEKGGGITVIDTKVAIGVDGIQYAEDETYVPPNIQVSPNTFDNLYFGINVYNSLSVSMTPSIIANDFLDVQKGITLNTVPFATVYYNYFRVPNGTGNEEDEAYGILAQQSFGFDISENHFKKNPLITMILQGDWW